VRRANLAKAAMTPGHRRTAAATHLTFSRYIGLGRGFCRKRMCAVSGDTPVMYA
jgi:hypothetical protein